MLPVSQQFEKQCVSEESHAFKSLLTCSSCFDGTTAFFPLLLIFQSLEHDLDHWDAEGLQKSVIKKTFFFLHGLFVAMEHVRLYFIMKQTDD